MILTTVASLAVLVVHVIDRRVDDASAGATLTLVGVEADIYRDPGSAKRHRVTPIN